FYGSTPAYRPVLDHHGWGDLQTELNTLSKQGKWVEMGEVVDDTVLRAFAVVGAPEDLASEITHRFGGLLDRIQFYAHDPADPERWSEVIDALRSA
ncbi:MAG: LLM class F420-dependent oxidoreductase, partial [Acidimicrobiales bacterium]|nr:LLM class F420-dependent oxidoreductase [Acidimicrobiales bacterium]